MGVCAKLWSLLIIRGHTLQWAWSCHVRHLKCLHTMKMVLIFNAHTYFHHSVRQHKNRNRINKAHLEHRKKKKKVKSCILNLTVDIHVISYHAVLAKCVYLKILETKIFSVFMSDRFWVPSIRWHTMFWYLAATFVFKQLYTSFKLTCGIVGL